MPWDAGNDVSYNNIHDVMQMLGDGGAIYTLGPQGNRPYPKGPVEIPLATDNLLHQWPLDAVACCSLFPADEPPP